MKAAEAPSITAMLINLGCSRKAVKAGQQHIQHIASQPEITLTYVLTQEVRVNLGQGQLGCSARDQT
jgi:hypothetical protein